MTVGPLPARLVPLNRNPAELGPDDNAAVARMADAGASAGREVGSGHGRQRENDAENITHDVTPNITQGGVKLAN